MIASSPSALRPFIFGCLLLTVHPTSATECIAPADTVLAPQQESSSGEDAIDVESGRVNATRDGAEFVDKVTIRRGNREISAEAARFYSEENRLDITGPVVYRDSDVRISADDAELDADTQTVEFRGAGFDLPSRPARGRAEALRISADQTLALESVSYTTCPATEEDWSLEAGYIGLDTVSGIGVGRNVRLNFQGIPILYTPYISFPISDKRKSGFLIPNFRQSDSSGTDIALPYYFNLASNYDWLFTPRLLTKRGIQLGSEFRYLFSRGTGELTTEFLPNDSVFGESRTSLRFNHESLFGINWRLTADINDVSDKQYFEDLGSSLASTSQTNLDRRIDLEFFAPNWRFLARLQSYRNLDELIAQDERPYKRLPQMGLQGAWAVNALEVGLESELVSFDRDVGVTGWRFDAAPRLSLPFQWLGVEMEPALAWRHTRYRLEDTAPGQRDDPSRSLPVASLDLRLRLERQLRRFTQTLEPRIRYVHIPFENQDALPIFDTIEPDFNLVQLYADSNILGADRVPDTDRVAAGVTTRLIDETTGAETLRVTLGQLRYLSTQNVSLPGTAAIAAETSDYIAELGLALYRNWNLDLGYQWNSATNSTSTAEARIQYLPGNNRVLNLAYRFRRQTLEQGDVSFAWPVGERWNVVGRYNYSFLDKKNLESFLGLEYGDCCWRIRLVGRRYVSRRTGETDNSIAIQLELRGLTSVGDPADKLLERGILGYQSR